MSPSIYSRQIYSGQQIIPLELMEDLAEGDKATIHSRNGYLILKDIEEISINDLKFSLIPDKAWKRIKKSEVVEMDIDSFYRKFPTWA
jgi:hypothetical protein